MMFDATLMTPWAKWMIRWHYLFRSAPHGVMRQLQAKCHHGMRLDRYNSELRVAVSLLKKNIDMRVRRHYSPTSQLDSSSLGETDCLMAVESCPEGSKPAAAR